MGALVDANIFLRYFTGDDPKKAARCERLFRTAAEKQLSLRVSDVCLAEVVWTLESFYGAPRNDTADKLVALLNTPGLVFSDANVLLDAAQRYRNTKVDFIDAYHAALAVSVGHEVYSYDRDFDRFDDVTRKEP